MKLAAGALITALAIAIFPAQVTAQSGSPVPAVKRCALVSLPANELGLRDAFAHPVQDVPTLRFLALIYNSTPEQQRKSFALAKKEVDPRTLEALKATVDKTCAGDEISYRAARAEILLLSSWKQIATGDQNFANLQDSLLVAIASLAVRGSLSADSIDAALSPFGTNLAVLSASGAPSASGCVPDSDAKVLKTTQPEFPLLAVAKRATGAVRVVVTLNDQGLVENASVYDAPDGDQGAVDAFQDSSVLAAASSTYAPEIEKCKPVRSVAIFRAEYELK
jgi:hypothetical protein